jgi:anti-sigma B factor antagonist
MDDIDGTAPLTITVTDAESGPVIKAAGELDASNVDMLHSVIKSRLREAPESLSFDLADLTFMDTSGIALLIQTSKSGTAVRILAPSAPVRTVIRMTGLDGILVMEP